MKNFIIKISAAVVLCAGIASCSKDALRSYDTQQQLDAVESINDPFLLSSVIKQSTLFYQGLGYDNSRLPGAVQYMERNFQGGDNTYQGFKSPTTELYSATNVLKLVDAAIDLAEKRDSKTHVGIFKIFRSLLFSFMTDFYGDIYYTEALRGREGILYPKYDKQADIYAGLLAELEEANTLIANGTEDFNATYDLMFAGDKVKWQKFANSLRIRLLMRASNKLPDAGAQIAAIVSNPSVTPIFTEASDNASIEFIGTTAENSWKGGTNNWSKADEFDRRRPAKTLVDKLYDLKDPRQHVWLAPVEKPWTSDPAKNGVEFTTTDPNGFTYTSKWEYIDTTKAAIKAQYNNIEDSNKVYAGFQAGMIGDFKNGNGHYDTDAGGVVGNFKVSRYSKLFRENKHPLLRAVIMNADEIQFILAELAAKGVSLPKTADQYYRDGITLSMKRWGVSQAAIDTYLAQPSIALPGTQQGDLEKIADQKWLGLFFVSTEAYLDLRRTKLPNIFNNGRLGSYDFPLRFRYPGNELGMNKDAYDAGVSTLQPANDVETAKMWLLQ